MDPTQTEKDRAKRVEIIRNLVQKDTDRRGISQLMPDARELWLVAEVSEIAGAIIQLTKILDEKLDQFIKHDRVVAGILRDICGKMPEPL